MFTVGVFAIILNKEKQILLCHRKDYDLWNLPGGKLEKGEVPWEGVAREVKEETGLNVKIKKLVGIYSKPEKNDIVFQFLCNIVGGRLRINDEADKIEYFSLDGIPKNTIPKQVERIKDYFKRDSELVLKIQKGPSSIKLVKQGRL